MKHPRAHPTIIVSAAFILLQMPCFCYSQDFIDSFSGQVQEIHERERQLSPGKPEESPVSPSGSEVTIMKVEDIRPGMTGVAYTVFQGVHPEKIDLEVVDVLPNFLGPRQHAILVQLHGEKVERTGVVAGMSGSPVYINGRLVGALSLKFGLFTKDPIAGVTPIQYMLDVKDVDRRNALVSALEGQPSGVKSTPVFAQNFDHKAIVPMEILINVSGFARGIPEFLASPMEKMGFVFGVGSVTDAKLSEQTEPPKAGDMISAILVRGDMSMAAACTVTYVDSQNLLACGHPFMRFGSVSLPMAKGKVLMTLASSLTSTKIVNATEEVGAFVQDRATAILGHFGEKAEMIPISFKLHGDGWQKSLHVEMARLPKPFGSFLFQMVFMNILQGINESGSESAYRLQERIHLKNHPDIVHQDVYVPPPTGMPPLEVFTGHSLGDGFEQLLDNPYARPDIQGVDLDVELIAESLSADLEKVETSVSQARPGETVLIKAAFRPYRREVIVKEIPFTVPAAAPQGKLQIIVGDADALNKKDKAQTKNWDKEPKDFAGAVNRFNQERSNNRLYVQLRASVPKERGPIERSGEAKGAVSGIPLSIANVMRDQTAGEKKEEPEKTDTVLAEYSIPLDYALLGSVEKTITIK